MRLRNAAAALLLLFSLGCTQPPVDVASEEPALDPDQVAAEVRSALEAYGSAINSGDLEVAASYYADDPRFIWVEDGLVAYESAAEAAESLAQVSQYGTVQVDFSQLRVDALSNDVATVFTTHTTTVGEGDASFAFSGALTITMMRIDGGWKFVSGHSSSPQQLNSDEEAR